MEPTDRLKTQTAGLSLATNIGLTVIKVIAAATSGSVSLLSEAAHSATDVVTSSIAFFSVRAANAPPDAEHPYGHGKIESLAGFGESTMLLGIAVYVVFQAVDHIRHPAPLQHLDLALFVMAAGAVATLSVGLHVKKVGEASGSLALRSNGQHLLVDFWTSLGVVVALALTKFTGFREADGYVALLLALWIAWGAYAMSRLAYDQLVDRRISDEHLECIHQILRAEPRLISYHRLRSRQAGNVQYVDLHVVVPRDWSVVQAHDLADDLEKEIRRALDPAQVVIHVDPFDPSKVKG